MKTICLSGGMDPIHTGHISMIRDASQYGDVIVILNSDDWLINKKGYAFMPWEERAEILRSIKWVTDVVPVDDSDGTVCEALRRVKPDYFGNGGDRTAQNTPEKSVCKELGIELVWKLGKRKIISSSDLINNVIDLIAGDRYEY